MASYRFVSMEKNSEDDYVMVLEKMPGFFGWLFGYKPKEVTFIGSCTVWYNYPSFERCGSMTEWMLTEFYHYGKYHNKGLVK